MERPPHAGLADRYRAEPHRAAVTQRVRTELGEGMRCETTSRGHTIVADELGVALERVTVEVEGDIDLRGYLGLSGDVPPGYSAMRISVRLEGPETEERYRLLSEEAERHCPMIDTLLRPVPLERALLLGPEPG